MCIHGRLDESPPSPPVASMPPPLPAASMPPPPPPVAPLGRYLPTVQVKIYGTGTLYLVRHFLVTR